MKPTLCVVQNFGSFKSLDFDFSDSDLALISGDTGAGKSTFADFCVWALFGTTSKGGAADDVRTWGSDDKTSVEQTVELSDGTITVTRIRGKATQNDLYWVEAASPESKVRGKDAADTQRLLNERLGIDADLYSLSFYFSQFSEADRFFIMKPRERREILEKISVLDTPVLLAERASAARKATKKELEAVELSLSKNQGSLEQARLQLQDTTTSARSWDEKHLKALAKAEADAEDWVKTHSVSVKAAEHRMFEWKVDWERSRKTCEENLSAFDHENDAKMQGIVSQLDEIADKKCVVGDAASLLIKQQVAVQELSRLKDDKNTTSLEKAKLNSSLQSLQTQYDKILSAPDTCPECLGPSCNDNSKAFLTSTKEYLDNGKETLSLLDRAAKEQEIAIAAQEAGVKALEKELNDVRAAMLKLEMDSSRLSATLETAVSAVNPYIAALDHHLLLENPHSGAVAQLKKAVNPHVEVAGRLKDETNPHTDQVSKLARTEKEQESKVAKDVVAIQTLSHRSALLTTLYDLSFTLRGELLRSSVKSLEFETNRRLTNYFDGEFKVSFSLDDDKLGVEIAKGEHTAPYRSLSGGQRRMLVLSFFFALRRLALDKAGVEAGLFLGDEMLNGLDDALKIKAYRMLEELASEHTSVYVIDHSEAFKAMFDTKYEVTLEGDESVVRCA